MQDYRPADLKPCHTIRSSNMPPERESMFSGLCIYIHPAGLGKKRLSLFETQIVNNGGKLKKSSRENLVATHVVVDESVAQDTDKLKTDLVKENIKYNDSIRVVRTQWLSKCLKEKRQVNTAEYEVSLSCDTSIMQYVNAKNLPKQESPSQSNVQVEEEPSPSKKLRTAVAESAPSTTGECNQLIIGELQKLAGAFRSSGDQWRAHGYDKAVSAIKAYGKEITRMEDVALLPNIGQKMAAKIEEILEFGKLRKVDEVCNNERIKVVELFNKVWGVGPSTAESWYLQGYRTLEDLQTKANLTKQQKIGLKYFEEIQDSIPREEVDSIFSLICAAAHTMEPSLKLMLVGSYRRGKQMCGDVDVLITRPPSVPSDILTRVVTQLRDTGFLSDDLVSMEANGKQKKYLGLCCLPGENHKHRRIDIFLVPESEYAPALMHYTGGALFNRSVRILAAKKGMSLSEHSLTVGVQREGKNIINEGRVVSTPTEESIFEYLELPYRPPEQRNHSV